MPIDKAILKQLRASDPTLTSIELRIDDASELPELFEALKGNKTLQSIKFSGYSGIAIARGLADVLKHNKSLRSIDLSALIIESDASVQPLLEALNTNQSLTSLELGGYLTRSLREAIDVRIMRNQLLQAARSDRADSAIIMCNLLERVREKYPDVGSPVPTHPELAAVYREYNNYMSLSPDKLSPPVVALLLTAPYAKEIQTEINKALASYLFANRLSLPEDNDKNRFRLIISLLRDCLDVDDPYIENMARISAQAVMGTLDSKIRPSDINSETIRSLLNTSAFQQAIESDKQIVLDHLMMSREQLNSYQTYFDKLEKQLGITRGTFINQLMVINSRVQAFKTEEMKTEPLRELLTAFIVANPTVAAAYSEILNGPRVSDADFVSRIRDVAAKRSSTSSRLGRWLAGATAGPDTEIHKLATYFMSPENRATYLSLISSTPAAVSAADSRLTSSHLSMFDHSRTPSAASASKGPEADKHKPEL